MSAEARALVALRRLAELAGWDIVSLAYVRDTKVWNVDVEGVTHRSYPDPVEAVRVAVRREAAILEGKEADKDEDLAERDRRVAELWALANSLSGASAKAVDPALWTPDRHARAKAFRETVIRLTLEGRGPSYIAKATGTTKAAVATEAVRLRRQGLLPRTSHKFSLAAAERDRARAEAAKTEATKPEAAE